MSIRLVTFDLDDTFWDIAPVIESAEARLRDWLAEHAPRLGAVPVERLWQIRARLLEQDPTLRHRLSTLRRQVLWQALGQAGYRDDEARTLAEQAFQIYFEARHQVTLFPDVQPTLEVLANRYCLGVLTNGNAKVERLGLADYFRFALCAEDLGVGKPDPRPFQEALRRAGVAAAEAVHVGDHPADDIQGAQAAGLRAIWFNPAGKAWGEQPPPDAQIRSLAQLPALLAGWARGA